MIFINEHEIVLDERERLEPWTTYHRVVSLAMDFIKRCPIDPANQLPWYLQYSCFWTDPLRPTIWPDNPAGKYAWAVTTALKYYPYSADAAFIDITRGMLDRLWEYRTPQHFSWSGVPYASAHPGTGIYFGARADGEYASEPDKIALAGKACLNLYEVCADQRYLQMGRHIAEELVRHLRQGDPQHSPWPFRVDVRDGRVIEEYGSNMIASVRLFDELVHLGETRFQEPRDQVWSWIEEVPLRSMCWKGYFEDIRLDPANENRDQYSPLETARYILENRQNFPAWREQVKGLIDWVQMNLGCQPFFSAIPVHEQKYCWHAMGSHTARFACLCALYAQATGDEHYREKALRSFNWASYMADEDGTVKVGVDRPDYYNQCWFTDGYFDYVPHFIDGMAALPQMAPADSDHMLGSTSPIQSIAYQPYQVAYRTFDVRGGQALRLTFEPQRILSGGSELPRQEELSDKPGWSIEASTRFIVNVRPSDREVVILGNLSEMPGSPEKTQPH